MAIFAPDNVRDNFAQSTEAGGRDEPRRGLRYLMWTWDPDPSDGTYVSDFAYLLHEEGQPMRSVYDRHVHGLSSRATWLRLLEEAGSARRPSYRWNTPDVEPGSVDVFVALRPAG